MSSKSHSRGPQRCIVLLNRLCRNIFMKFRQLTGFSTVLPTFFKNDVDTRLGFLFIRVCPERTLLRRP